MRKPLFALLATVCLALPGCLHHGSSGRAAGPGGGAAAPTPPTDSYTVEEHYSLVLDNIKGKMRECDLYQYSSRFQLNSGRRDADYVVFGGLGAVVFQVRLQYLEEKKTAVDVYAPLEGAEWHTATEAVRRGVFGVPGCPAKE